MKFNLESDVITFAAPEDNANPEDKNKFTMVGNSGLPFSYYGDTSMVIDLESLKFGHQRKPILLEHDRQHRVGFSENIRVESNGLILEGFMLDNEIAKTVLQDSKSGYPFQASISIEVKDEDVEEIELGETILVNNSPVKGPALIMRKGHLKECSFVSLGADEQTNAVAFSKLISNCKLDQGQENQGEENSIMELDLSEVTLEQFSAAHPDIIDQLVDEKVTAEKELALEQTKVEKDRVSLIISYAKTFGLTDYSLSLIENGETEDIEDKFKSEKAREIEAAANENPGVSLEDKPAEELVGEELWKKEFSTSEELQSEFGALSTYLAFQKANTDGRVKILSK